MALSVLYVGGTGQISLPCVELSVAAGHRVSVFNRGRANTGLPNGVTVIAGDMNAADGYAGIKGNFDVVAQFMAFTPEQMQRDIATFTGRTGQYVFISSASVYQKPAKHYIITEEKTPAENPYWEYSQRKIACEKMLQDQKNLAWTIVRPSHTVRTGIPSMLNDGDMTCHRMLAGKPVVVCGDGTTPWTLTRSVDVAAPFVKLLGNKSALREIFHITSDRGYLWNDIYATIAHLLGVEAKIVNVPTATLVRYHKAWEGPLLGDKTWTALFDNSKVKRVAGPFTCSEKLDEILAEPIANFRKRLAEKGPQTGELDALMDRVAADQSGLGR